MGLPMSNTREGTNDYMKLDYDHDHDRHNTAGRGGGWIRAQDASQALAIGMFF